MKEGAKLASKQTRDLGMFQRQLCCIFLRASAFFKNTICRVLTFKLIFSDCEPLTVFFLMFCDVIDFDIDFLYNI